LLRSHYLQPLFPATLSSNYQAALYTATQRYDGTGAFWGSCCLLHPCYSGSEEAPKDVLLAASFGRAGSTAVTHRCTEAEQAVCFDVLFQISSFCNCLAQACHSSGHKSPAYRRGNLGWTPGQYLRDLWLTKWHWERLLSKNFCFLLSLLSSVLLHKCYTHLHTKTTLMIRRTSGLCQGTYRQSYVPSDIEEQWLEQKLSHCFHVRVSVWGDCTRNVTSLID
jgi:hypothetical protein